MEYVYCKHMPPKRPVNNLVLRPNKHLTPNNSITDEGDSLYSASDKGDADTSLLDVTTPTIGKPNLLNVEGTPSPSTTSAKKKKVKCPCGKSDQQSTYVICAKCKLNWHNRCCNLVGLTQCAIKKLELWECPKCYSCPLLNNQPATMYAELLAVQQQIGSLMRTEKNHKELGNEIAELREHVAELTRVTNDKETRFELSPDLENAIKKVSTMEIKSLTSIETNLTNLTEQMETLQSSIKTLSEPKPSPDPNPTGIPHTHKPNTNSPHNKEISTPCEPYTTFLKDTVPPELKNKLLKLVEESDESFKKIGEGSREVLYYGEYSYIYTGHKHESLDMPDPIKELMEIVASKSESDSSSKPNSCLVTKYRSGTNYIPPHRDDEPVIGAESDIFTVSIGSERSMTFVNNNKSQSRELKLEDCSLLISTRYAQDFWTHGILPDESQDMRVSFTFRNIAPHNLNSTKILGDSNSAKIHFGAGTGCLGSWVPGKRVKVGHIEALPDATEIGAYRNIILHTGINSLNTKHEHHRRSHSYLLHVLESKCKDYLAVYPKLNIYISTLLPTRIRSLNRDVEQFNRGILDICYRIRNVRVIENSIFGNVLTDEYGRWDFNAQRPLTSDALHLGRKGIRTLAMNFKAAVLRKSGTPGSQSRSRFNASRGSYHGALERTRHQDGYQPSW